MLLFSFCLVLNSFNAILIIEFETFLLSGVLGPQWIKHYCLYTKENKILTMVPYTQTNTKLVSCWAWSREKRIVTLRSNCCCNIYFLECEYWHYHCYIMCTVSQQLSLKTISWNNVLFSPNVLWLCTKKYFYLLQEAHRIIRTSIFIWCNWSRQTTTPNNAMFIWRRQKTLVRGYGRERTCKYSSTAVAF